MGNKFAELAFTDAVKEMQELMGSRKSYACMEAGRQVHHELTEDEADFISRRNLLYMVIISETGFDSRIPRFESWYSIQI